MSSTDASGAAEAPLRIIAGPTGAGKSAIALALAEARASVVISADSRQIYRGFDVGTAKPSAAERQRVPHEGVDVADPTERWSAARWAVESTAWLESAATRGQSALIVGGTGLWLRALVHPLADEPPLDPDRRKALGEELAALSTPELRGRVEALDPARAHLGRTQLLRAAEVALLTGTRISDWHAAGASKPRRAARWLIVDPGPSLHLRLTARQEQMFAEGWVEEVEALRERVPADAPAWNACGYQEVRDLVEGRRSRAETEEAIRIRTRQYAKRQRTWFRNQLTDEAQIRRLDPNDLTAARNGVDWLFDGVTP